MSEKKSKIEWEGIISDWKQSGLTRSEYCREKDLKVSTLDYWKRKLRKAEETGFVKIDHPPARYVQASACMKITTMNFALELRPGVPANELRAVLSVCKELL